MACYGKPPKHLELPVAQARAGGIRPYSGVCGNRGKTIHRSPKYTNMIVTGGRSERVGRCLCGLLVFVQLKDPSDDYRGADHE